MQRGVTVILLRSALSALPLLLTSASFAGEADVIDVDITALGDDRYRIDATVRHDDAGWDHYADRWDVLAPDGTVLGARELLHPHDNEQPFTRSLTLTIPAGIETITVRAHDKVHGLGGASVQVSVPNRP